MDPSIEPSPISKFIIMMDIHGSGKKWGRPNRSLWKWASPVSSLTKAIKKIYHLFGSNGMTEINAIFNDLNDSGAVAHIISV